jgi:RimJ/RimL family protein N-acetyltransferase
VELTTMTETETSLTEKTETWPPPLIDAPLPDTFAIETLRLRLRPVRADDEEALHVAITESIAELSRWMPWCQNGYSRATGQAWLRRAIDSWAKAQDFALVIEDRHTGRVLGATGLNRIDSIGRWANLGYWLRTDATGCGLATEAAAAVARFGFVDLRLWRIEIVADVENLASRRVAEKLGATLECIARNRASIGDRYRDAAVYSLIPGEVKGEA